MQKREHYICKYSDNCFFHQIIKFYKMDWFLPDENFFLIFFEGRQAYQELKT